MSAAAPSMRCATPSAAGAAARCMSMRGGDAAGDTVARAIAEGRHRRPLRGVPRPRDAELHGAARQRGRRGGGAGRHGALRDGVSEADQAGEGARGDRGCRRHALRRQHPGRRAAAAGGAGRRQAALRHRHLAGQGGQADGNPACPLLPLHEPPRGGGARRHGRRRSGRGDRRQAAGARPCPRRHHAGQPSR